MSLLLTHTHMHSHTQTHTDTHIIKLTLLILNVTHSFPTYFLHKYINIVHKKLLFLIQVFYTHLSWYVHKLFFF